MLPYLTTVFVFFDGETALAACVLRATTRKRSSTFLRKRCIRVTWLDDFLTPKWPGSFTALAPPLVGRNGERQSEGMREWEGERDDGHSRFQTWLRPFYCHFKRFSTAKRCPTFDTLFSTSIFTRNDRKTFCCNFRDMSTLALGLRYIDQQLVPSQEVGSAWVSLSLVGCRCTGEGVFQRNPQS